MTSESPFPRRFTRIDRLTVANHRYLSKDDECYYLGEYTPGWLTPGPAWTYSPTNNVISNFKRSVEWREERPDVWAYKQQAIREVARSFSCGLWGLCIQQSFDQVACVPTPTHHRKDDPDYDSRLVDMLKIVVSNFNDARSASTKFRHPRIGIREWVQRLDHSQPAHKGNRLSPSELIPYHRVAVPQGTRSPRIIAIVDDVITEGAHYVAMRNLLSDKFPTTRIIGLFAARTVWIDDSMR